MPYPMLYVLQNNRTAVCYANVRIPCRHVVVISRFLSAHFFRTHCTAH